MKTIYPLHSIKPSLQPSIKQQLMLLLLQQTFTACEVGRLQEDTLRVSKQ